MRTIPRDIIDNLTYSLNKLSQGAQKAIREQISRIRYTDVADLRRQLIEILEPYFAAATDNAAAYAAHMYDEVREFAIGKPLGAAAVSNRDPEATIGAIKAFVGKLETGGIESVMDLLTGRMDYEIKKAAGDCIVYNGNSDPKRPRYARVPTGAETCGFCIMLASRGFVYHSKGSAGDLNHWHGNCDCRIVPGFEGATQVAGYNQKEYEKKYQDAVDALDMNALRNEYEEMPQEYKDSKSFNEFQASKITSEMRRQLKQ